MKSRVMIGLLIAGVLVISAAGQDNSGLQPTEGVMASLPRQPSSSTAMVPSQLQVPPESADAKVYPEQMQAVLQLMSDELGLIVQAVRDGKISRAEAEYLSVERYFVGLMRLQLVRSQHQNADEANQRESYSQANTAPQVSGDTVMVVLLQLPRVTFPSGSSAISS